MKKVKWNSFKSLDELLTLKKMRSETIAIVIPTLNEESSIANILTIIKSELVDGKSLVDDLIVIDGGSTDNTVSIVESLDVRCVDARTGTGGDSWPNGKGLALWRSQFVTDCSIIGFIDADIENFDNRFVLGLVAPFLQESDIGFVKGFYTRPIKNSEGIKDSAGGGRVTELLIRPLLSRFYPTATEFVQPLSGEYAFRKNFINKLRFYTGYGVETSLDLDYLRKFSKETIVQVDFEERIHRNRPLSDLGKMASVILQTVVDFAEEDGYISKRGDEDYYSLNGDQIVSEIIMQEKLPFFNEVVND
jgi:glucosyl-3-phosphoglycerate synthase